MAARLNIKNPLVVELAHRLARQKGKSITTVIRESLLELQERHMASEAETKTTDSLKPLKP